MCHAIGVSPVHAGIYLQSQSRSARRKSFPRSCGDIPVPHLLKHLRGKFPPFMRGYTCSATPVRQFASVSPVHAGIYLMRHMPYPAIECFPRSCGDIPQTDRRPVHQVWFPPFMRGYTQKCQGSKSCSWVSPVHAGIYLVS